MGLTSTIAELMLEKGRAQAAGQLGAGYAYGNLMNQFGNLVGNIPNQIEQAKQAQDLQRQRDFKKALSDAMNPSTVADIDQNGLALKDVKGIGDYMASKGFGAEFTQAAPHIDAYNQSLSQLQMARLGVLKTGAQGLLASGADPDLTKAMIRSLHHNQVFSEDTLNSWDQFLEKNPDKAGAILSQIVGAPKLMKVGPDESVINENNPTQSLYTAPGKKGEGDYTINGQRFGPDGTPKGPLVPKQATPLTDEEKQLKLKEAAKLDAEIKGTLPSEVDKRRELQLQRDRLTAEIQNWNIKNAAENPLAALGGVGTQIAVPGMTAPQAAPSGAPQAPAAPPVTPQGASPQAPPTGQPTPQQAIAGNLHGDDFLSTLPPSVATQVKLYASGRQPFPTGFALRSPYFQSMLNLVGQYDPSFDAGNYQARAKARSDFTSPNGKAGQAVTSLNRIAGHLSELNEAADALNNGNVQLYNQVANRLATAVGWKGKTNFDAIAPRVADEIERLWRGTGGSSGEIQQTLGNMNSSMSPDQLKGVIAKTVKLVQSQFDALKAQRDSAIGPFGQDILLETPQTQQIFDSLLSGKQAAPKGLLPGFKIERQ